MNILKIKLSLIISTLVILIYFNETVVAQCTPAEQPNCYDVPFGEHGLTIHSQYGATRLPNRNGISYIRGKEIIMSTANSHNQTFKIDQDGRVLIGAHNMAHPEFDTSINPKISLDDYRLFVQKGILAEKVKVAVKESTEWSDYVFEEDYERMPINELEDFVTENKHLPKVPSAEEMVENGLDVAKMDAKLLEKIEEAYLYIIDLNKKVDALANENENLKTSLQSISTSGK